MAIKAEFLRRLLIVWALALAFFQFSENTADPDLWGHVLFGEQMLRSGTVAKIEPYSWTASGQPWINHEVLAEVALAAAHRLAGGTGILLLKMLVGFAAFGLALRLALEKIEPAWKPVAWLVGALAVVEISFGFAARPQIFTVLGLAIEFWLLRRVSEGNWRWAFGLPALSLVWVNTHGGVLAGVALMFVAAAGNFWNRRRAAWTLALAGVLSAAALLVNPWGLALPKSIIEADTWNRSDILEWRATPLGWDHAAMFILLALAIISFALSRRPRAMWEMAVCGVLGFLAVRTVRHTPLFSLAALAFTPPHLADVIDRYRESFSRLLELLQTRLVGFLLAISSAAMILAAFFLHKENPLTMEAPRDEYPLGAIRFIREHAINGNALMFFDWGEVSLWELPKVAVSMDGRMDTCYSRELIEEHWKFYNGEAVDNKILDIDRADLALLPRNLAGTAALAKRPGWQAVYVDSLAAVLVRDAARFAHLPKTELPLRGPPSATAGRSPFPEKPSGRIYSPAKPLQSR